MNGGIATGGSNGSLINTNSINNHYVGKSSS